MKTSQIGDVHIHYVNQQRKLANIIYRSSMQSTQIIMTNQLRQKYDKIVRNLEEKGTKYPKDA